MRFLIVMNFFLSVLLLSIATLATAAPENGIRSNSCVKEQYRQHLEVGDSIIEIQSSCSNQDILDLSVKDGSSFKLLSRVLYPYSFILKPVKEVDSERNHTAVIQLAPSEPEPTGSYYFAVVDLESLTLIADGYSDSEISVSDIDKDRVEEIVYGENLSGVNSLETMLDFPPYPRVLDWNCHGGLHLVGNHAYPRLMHLYQKSLSNYIEQLTEKAENASGSMKVALDAELAFTKAMRVRQRKRGYKGGSFKC